MQPFVNNFTVVLKNVNAKWIRDPSVLHQATIQMNTNTSSFAKTTYQGRIMLRLRFQSQTSDESQKHCKILIKIRIHPIMHMSLGHCFTETFFLSFEESRIIETLRIVCFLCVQRIGRPQDWKGDSRLEIKITLIFN